MPDLKPEVFKPDEFDIHGFHDKRKEMLGDFASRICAGLIANPQVVTGPGSLQPEQRQVLADASLDLALRICDRLATKKSDLPAEK